MVKGLMFLVMSLVVAFGAIVAGEANAQDLCAQTQMRLQDLTSAAEECSESANKERRNRCVEDCWSSFHEISLREAERIIPRKVRKSLAVCSVASVDDFICTPPAGGGGGVATILVCGHPGGDCSLVACCASDDGCFVYKSQ